MWVDENGNEYKISINLSAGLDNESKAAGSGDSLRDINVEVRAILDSVHKLCRSIDTNNATRSFTDS
jgi:hypothetical protein